MAKNGKNGLGLPSARNIVIPESAPGLMARTPKPQAKIHHMPLSETPGHPLALDSTEEE